jgi:hypothetical protein
MGGAAGIWHAGACCAARGLVHWSQVKINGNSALAVQKFQNKMIEAGAGYFIAKSFNSVEITKFINKVYRS